MNDGVLVWRFKVWGTAKTQRREENLFGCLGLVIQSLEVWGLEVWTAKTRRREVNLFGRTKACGWSPERLKRWEVWGILLFDACLPLAASPIVIPKEERLRNLLRSSLPLWQKEIRSIKAGDSRLPAGQASFLRSSEWRRKKKQLSKWGVVGLLPLPQAPTSFRRRHDRIPPKRQTLNPERSTP